MRITLIEDEPECFENYQALLEGRGHSVALYRRADDVVEAMDKVCDADVIVLDLMMRLGGKINPNEAVETGTAIYKRVRNRAPQLPIVVLTARSKGEVWNDFSGDKFVQYLGKPVSDVEVFYKTIEGPHKK